MIDLINDISVLTDVSDTTLKKFLSISNYCIGHAVYEKISEKKDVAEINIGLGKLLLKVDENQILYKFIPSKDLEKILVQTVTTNSCPMMEKLDKNLQEKIDRAYKELI